MASTSSSATDMRSPSPAPSPQQQSSPRNPLHPDDFDLEDRVAKLLGTEDFVPLLESIIEYAENKEYKYLRIFKSFVCLYPESFCLKLNEILKFNHPLQIRSEIFRLLRYILRESVPVSSSVLFKLKQTILNSLIMETEDFLFPYLCELIGQVADALYRRYPIGSWDELLQYFISMISSFSESNRNKGFLLLTEFPTLVARNKKFWLNQGGFDIAYTSILQSFNTKGRNCHGMIRYFEKVAILVLHSLDELNHRVLWATMDAINILSECKELLMHTEYDKKLLEKLVPIAKRHCCARVQSYAVITIRQLEDTCGLKKTSLSDIDTGARTIAALQHSNVAGHRNVLTRTLDELEGEVNAASHRSLLTAKEVNDIVFGPRPAAEP